MKIFKTKKVILAVLTVIMFITGIPVLQSCSSNESDLYSQNASKSEIDNLKLDYKLKELDINNNPQSIKSFKTIDEARNYIESLKEIKISPLTIKYNKTSNKEGLFLLAVKDYVGKNLRFKVLGEGDYRSSVEAGFFSNFVFNFAVNSDGSVSKDNVHLGTTGVPIGWSYGSDNIRDKGNNTFLIIGHIVWGIAAGGQGWGYTQEANILVTVDTQNELVTFQEVR